MTLSEKIVFLRKQKGWSQEDLAAHLEVARQSISKWESGASLPELDKLLRMSELFGVTVDLLVKDSEIPCGVRSEASTAAGSTGADSEQTADSRKNYDFEAEDSEGRVREASVFPRIGRKEADAFLAFRTRTARMIALGVLLCVLSPIPLILLCGLSTVEPAPLTEGAACAIGLAALLLFIAPAVILFIISGMQSEPYAPFLRHEFTLDTRVEADLRAEKAATRTGRTVLYTSATALCILSPLPLLCTALLLPQEIPLLICVGLLLFLAGIAAALFTLGGVRQGGYDLLLREGDYAKSHTEEAISSAYWLIVTGIYLTVSFSLDNWSRSWIIWVGAAILYGAVDAILRAFFTGKSKSES